MRHYHLTNAGTAKEKLEIVRFAASRSFWRGKSPANPPAGGRKGGGAAPLKTAKEPGEKHRLEPYFNFGGRKFLII